MSIFQELTADCKQHLNCIYMLQPFNSRSVHGYCPDLQVVGMGDSACAAIYACGLFNSMLIFNSSDVK